MKLLKMTDWIGHNVELNVGFLLLAFCMAKKTTE